MEKSVTTNLNKMGWLILGFGLGAIAGVLFLPHWATLMGMGCDGHVRF